ncbi:hypothetical protein LTR36_001413 [Oleoguttula mirabilis]|uniref:Uncharacterized protein n=1 Tax=Oleoguttula mirabilis TaxID=1507867 RepID=A0AAV9JQF0_9PEZI|nr:hypothetical protein LTR36_001413 [Oleoguttula mirabilis]
MGNILFIGVIFAAATGFWGSTLAWGTAITGMVLTQAAWLMVIILPLTHHHRHHPSTTGIGDQAQAIDWYTNQDPLIPKIYVRVPNLYPTLQDDISGKSLSLRDWDKQSGIAHACWDDDPETCSLLHDFQYDADDTHCYDWTKTTVSDDIPKYMANGTLTPHGVVDFHIKVGIVDILPPNSQWAAPIAADCRYWDEDWHQKNETVAGGRITIPDIGPIKIEVPDGIQVPTNSTPDLVGQAIQVTGRRSLAGPASLVDFFSSIPRRRATDEIDRFAKQGAMVLHDHLRSDTSAGTFLALHRAATALLRTDDKHNKLWKRAVPFVKAPADADHVIEALINHVIDQTHDNDKMRMEAFATHAMMEAVVQRVAYSGQAQMVDVRLMNRAWERISPGGGF